MNHLILLILVTSFSSAHSLLAEEEAQTETSSNTATQSHRSVRRGRIKDRSKKLNPLFEEWEGGSQEAEEQIRHALVDKFVLLQVANGIEAGENLRGTHSQGVCMEGTLELIDPTADENRPKDYVLTEEDKKRDAEVKKLLKVGPYGEAYTDSKVSIRFADAASNLQPNSVKDVRAISIAFEKNGQRQDFSMNNGPTFTFGNVTDFNNYMAFGLFMGAKGKMLKAGLLEPKNKEKLGIVLRKSLQDALRDVAPEDWETTQKITQEVTQKVTAGFIMGEIKDEFFAKNPDIAKSVAKTTVLGDQQKNKDVYSYQTENYGTGSAFSYGKDKAAKFSLVQCGGKAPKRDVPLLPTAAPDVLVARLRPEEVCFELRTEFLSNELDADGNVADMLDPSGKKLKPWQWVADATLDWGAAKKKAKPGVEPKTYLLGRLKGNKDSIKSQADCDNVKNGFDVNSHRFADFTPLGPINRARREAEDLSKRMRDHTAQVHSRTITPFSETGTMEQGWDYEQQQNFWYKPQGSYVVPYNMFKALRTSQLDAKTGEAKRFTDTLVDLGFIQSGHGPTKLNPDGFPIGFTTEPEPSGNFPQLKGKGPWLGVNCAACHTGSVTATDPKTGVTKNHIIDGAPAKIDFQKFSLTLEQAFKETLNDKKKLQDFMDENERLGTPVSKADIEEVYNRMVDRHTNSYFPNKDRKNPPVNGGVGRTDALNAIMERVLSHTMGVEKKDTAGTAPVSFPSLWGAPYREWVQWGGTSKAPNTRNDGEGSGVHGEMNLNPDDKEHYLESTVRINNQREHENALRALKSPKWVDVFGVLDEKTGKRKFTARQLERIERGKAIFHGAGKCSECHNTENLMERGKVDPVKTVDATEFKPDFSRSDEFIGTDPNYFAVPASRWAAVDTKQFKGSSPVRKLLENDPGLVDRLRFADDVLDKDGKLALDDAGKPKRGPRGKGYLANITNLPRYGAKENGGAILGEIMIARSIQYMADPANGIIIGPTDSYYDLTAGTYPQPQTHLGAFEAPNLSGIWARGPYLHNDSVRTLRDLLKPTWERPTSFARGDSAYDSEDVGFKDSGPDTFDGSKMGNLPIGHDKGTSLLPSQKEDLLWYLKSL